MSTYLDGSTSIVRYDVPRATSVRPGVTYTTERDFPRATRYNSGIGYNSRGYDYPYSYDDLTLVEQRELELEEIRMAEYRRNEFSRTGTAIITPGGARRMYETSRRLGIDRYPSSRYAPGVQTVTVGGSGPIIHRAVTKYTNQPVHYGFGDRAVDYDGLPVQVTRIPAGGRSRGYRTMYDSTRGFGAACGYENGCREPLVVIPASRTLSPRRYL